mgnify:CR=1 FL=1
MKGRRALGRALLAVAGLALAAFIAHRRAVGSPEIPADTDPRNNASIRLLQRHGFAESGPAGRPRAWSAAPASCSSRRG